MQEEITGCKLKHSQTNKQLAEDLIYLRTCNSLDSV